MEDTAIDFSALDAPAENRESVGNEVAPVESAEPSTEGEGGEQQEQAQQPTRVNYRNVAKAASEAMPEQAGALRDMAEKTYKYQAYEAIFKKPEEAQAAKSLIETLGGTEGIGQIQERISYLDNQDEMLRSGNPAVLDEMFKDFPEGAAALAEPFLERLARTAPDTYQSVVGGLAVDMIVNAGVAQALQDAFNAEDPKPYIQRLYNWLAEQTQGRNNLRAASSNSRATAPSRFEQEQQKLNKERDEIFAAGVQQRSNAIVQPVVDSAIADIGGRYRLNDGQKEHLRASVVQHVIAQMNADANYKRQIDIRRRAAKGNPDSVAGYMANEFNQRFKAAVPEVARTIYGAPKAVAQGGSGAASQGKGAPKVSASGGPLMLARRPDNSQIDFNRPDSDLMLIKRQGYLKDGRFVQWP